MSLPQRLMDDKESLAGIFTGLNIENKDVGSPPKNPIEAPLPKGNGKKWPTTREYNNRREGTRPGATKATHQNIPPNNHGRPVYQILQPARNLNQPPHNNNRLPDNIVWHHRSTLNKALQEYLRNKNQMEFRPSLEFHPGAPYTAQQPQSAQPAQQPAQAGNTPFPENSQSGQWLQADQNHHGGMPHGSMSHTGMPHAGMPHGNMSHGTVPHGGIHPGNMPHANVNQAGIPLWPHQQPGVVSAGRQFSLHGQERPYYGPSAFSYSHQQAAHSSTGHPHPGSYVSRIPSTQAYEVSYTPPRNVSMNQVQMVNRGGNYQLQHPQVVYNTPQGENNESRAQKQIRTSKSSASKVQESPSTNFNVNAPVSPSPMPGSANKRHIKRQQRFTEYQGGSSLKAPPAFVNPTYIAPGYLGAGPGYINPNFVNPVYVNGGSALGGNGQNSYSEANQHTQQSEYENEQEQKRERIKAKVEQEFERLAADSYDVKMDRWMDFEEDEFCPV